MRIAYLLQRDQAFTSMRTPTLYRELTKTKALCTIVLVI